MFKKYHPLCVVILLFLLIVPGYAAQEAPVNPIDETVFLDVEWYRETLVHTIDLWNGGLTGNSGMGTYRDDFDGFFHVALNQQWRPMPMAFSTSVAQSRAIYINVEAYRAASPEDKPRFLKAVNDGVDGLMTYFYDSEYGGFFWEVNEAGEIINDLKQGYGNIHPLFALAHAYSITKDIYHLQAALNQLEIFETYYFDPEVPGAVRPNLSRDFSEVIGVNNIDVMTHVFETLLALYDVTEGETQAHIADLIVTVGDFMTGTLYHDQDGFTDRGYFAYNFDDNWLPSQIPYTRDLQWAGAMHATPGHNIELAYLFSRAVERGFNPEWLETADKLIKFCLEYAIVPETGGMLPDITDYEGQNLADNPDHTTYIWWPQAETARALLHFTVVRGAEYGDEFKRVESLINNHLTDPEYGGWYHGLDALNDLAPVNPNKGDIWKVAYHYSMYFSEVLRLGERYPEQLAALQ